MAMITKLMTMILHINCDSTIRCIHIIKMRIVDELSKLGGKRFQSPIYISLCEVICIEKVMHSLFQPQLLGEG